MITKSKSMKSMIIIKCMSCGIVMFMVSKSMASYHMHVLENYDQVGASRVYHQVHVLGNCDDYQELSYEN